MNFIEFEILGQPKSGKNNMGVSRSGHHYPKAAWAEWRNRVVGGLAGLPGMRCFQTECRMIVKYWHGDKRRRDIPGMVDALYHCLERAQILKDDSLVKELHWEPQGYNKANPRVVIRIEELANGLD